MISLRYHVVTIVAVFLAVGLGLLAGNTVVQPALVRNLERQTEELRGDLADLRSRVSGLEAEAGKLEAAGDILSLVDDGGLEGIEVVVVTHDDVDGDLLTTARTSLDTAGAETMAVLSVTGRMSGEDGLARADLAAILGMPADADPAELLSVAAERLAERLVDGAEDPEDPEEEGDVLDDLLRGSFLGSLPPGVSAGDLPGIGGADQVFLVVAGGTGEPAVLPEAFLLPLVRDLAERGVTVAAGESASTEYAFVSSLRSDGAVPDGTRMVTVDHLDFPIGGAALVLGLERLLTLGEGGHYGIRGDAAGPIPPLT